MAGTKHRNGIKAGGKHTTLIDAAMPVYNFLQKEPLVTSIVAGQIKTNLKTAPHRVLIKENSGCLSVKVRGTKSIQELKVYSKEIENLKQILEIRFR
jgi:hypothetical protein